MLASDRVVANTHEQMTPFLLSMWLYAIFISPTTAAPTTAAWLGGFYVALRFVYPFLIGKKISKVQSKRVIFVTFPCYFIIFYMLGSVAFKALGYL
jgi:hypothetical protein